MVKKKKVDHDKYYHLAKEHGYRSRASFKLIQLNKKFDFLGSVKCCIDLCAAPGGWLQVAQKFMPKQSLIIGVDLLPIRPIRDVFTLEEDITTAKCRGELNRLMKGMKANLVLHDGAPNVGTSWEQDAFTQSTLTLASLRLATEFLAPNGMFVTKVFRSSDYNSLLWVFKQLFTKVTVTKPPASRNTSAEIYAVCQGYLAPKEIDHRFLDPKHVFKELDTVAESQLLKGMKRASRHREGYDEDAGQSTLLFKQSSILDFLHAEFPVEVLSKNYVLEWKERKSSTSPAEIEADKAMIAQLWNHRKTKADIKEGVSDIKNMSHRGIKQLLRWRLDMREAFVDGPKNPNASAKKIEEEEPVDPEKKEEDELQTLLKKLEMRQKRKDRKERKKRAKQQHRIDLKLDIPNDRFDTDAQEGNDLFRLSSIVSVDQLTQVNKGEISGVNEMLNELSDDELADDDESEDDDTLSLDEQDKRRKRELERTLELQYREFMDQKKRREEEPQSTRRKKRKHAETTLQDVYAEIDRTNNEILEKAKEKAGGSSSSSSSSKDSDKFYHDSDSEDDEDSGDEETKRLRSAERDLLIQAALMTRSSSNPLIRKNKQSASAQSKLWFDNELFEGAEEEIDDNAFAPKKPKKDPKKAAPSKKTAMQDDAEDADETVEDNVYSEEEEDAEMALQTALDQGEDDDDYDNDDATAKKYKELLAATSTPSSSKDKGKSKSKAKEGDFEVVPFEEKYTVRADEDTQEIIEEIEALEDHEKAQLLAMATLVKTGRMSWSQLLDFGFNRYCFTDSADAPQWFRDDESRHNKPRLPVTKQMMDEIRAEWREISSRPIKKVAEAKARKRIRSKKQLDAIKNKANAIVADNELSEAQKRRQIEKLHKKRSASEKPKVVTVVRKKFQKNKRRVGPKGKTGTKIKVVDGRMKKELRAQKRKAASKKR